MYFVWYDYTLGLLLLREVIVVKEMIKTNEGCFRSQPLVQKSIIQYFTTMEVEGVDQTSSGHQPCL